MLELKNVSIGYNGNTIISNINAKINPGDFIGIIGPNGAGKSTLLKSILGLIPISNGEILLHNKETKSYSNKEFAKEIAYLQQNLNINFGYTAKEIVMAGRYTHKKWWQGENEADDILVSKCLAYTGTENLQDTPLEAMSGGQRQRVLLAKVLAQQTPILFLDEPTTGLDIVYQEEIFSFAKELSNMGKTVVMVIHELALAAKYCEKIWLLGNNQLLAQDVPAKVITESLLSEAYHSDLKIINYPDGNFYITQKNLEDLGRTSLLKEICHN